MPVALCISDRYEKSIDLSPPELADRKQISLFPEMTNRSVKAQVKAGVRYVVVMVKIWLRLQEMNESQSNAALHACFGVCALVCVVHEKKISSTNGKFFLSWIKL